MDPLLNRPIQVLNIMVPVCPHLAGHPLFNRHDGLLQQRLGNAIDRELALLVAEIPEDGSDGSRHGSEFYPGGPVPTVTPPPSDGCVTATPHSLQDSLDRSKSELQEGDFVAGIRESSSPIPGPSSCNPKPASRTEATSDFMCTNSQPADACASCSSSVLPAFPMPDLDTSVETICVRQPRVKNSLTCKQTLVPSDAIRSIYDVDTISAPSSVITSASHNLAPMNSLRPAFPPPLANVSMSEVKSSGSTDRVPRRKRGRPQISSSHRARALLKGSGMDVPRGRRVTKDERYDSMLRVAHWLLQCSHDGDRHDLCPSGARCNPVVLDDDSSND